MVGRGAAKMPSAPAPPANAHFLRDEMSRRAFVAGIVHRRIIG
jgi:hypothetical protein